MNVEFDAAKNLANQIKHGLPLDAFRLLDFETAFFIEDGRRAYGEQRWRMLAMMDNRLYAAVFTMRGEAFRIISLRKANQRERKIHETARTR